MKEYNCTKCGGFVGEPMKAYGYAGKWCHCNEPGKPDHAPTPHTEKEDCACNDTPGMKCSDCPDEGMPDFMDFLLETGMSWGEARKLIEKENNKVPTPHTEKEEETRCSVIHPSSSYYSNCPTCQKMRKEVALQEASPSDKTWEERFDEDYLIPAQKSYQSAVSDQVAPYRKMVDVLLEIKASFKSELTSATIKAKERPREVLEQLIGYYKEGRMRNVEMLLNQLKELLKEPNK